MLHLRDLDISLRPLFATLAGSCISVAAKGVREKDVKGDEGNKVRKGEEEGTRSVGVKRVRKRLRAKSLGISRRADESVSARKQMGSAEVEGTDVALVGMAWRYRRERDAIYTEENSMAY